MDTMQQITKARAALILDQPFFGTLALRLKPKIDNSSPTAWTNGREIAFNEKFVESLSLDQLKGLICHEVMHCAAGHITRRQNRDMKKWNVAGDYAINQIIEDARMTLPPGRLISSRFAGMHAEAIFAALPTDAGQGPNNGPGDSDPGQCGEVRDAPAEDGNGPPSPADMSQTAVDWEIAVRQAAQAAKARGNLPGGLKEFIKAATAHPAPWRDILRRFITETAKDDYQWSRPNRRFIHQGVYLPSLHSEKMGRVAIVIDTSGSISSKELSIFGAELSAILEDTKASALLMYCDTSIQKTLELSPDNLPLTLESIGGGGTDFRPPFKYIEDHDHRPVCLVYLTDMEGCFPDTPPPYPVLWATTENHEAPFGEIVKINTKV